MKRIIITTGEPAGIGPDVVIAAARNDWPAQLVVLGDRQMLTDRAAQLGIDLTLLPYDTTSQPSAHKRGNLPCIHLPLGVPCRPGQLNPGNASYVLAQLELGTELCLEGDFSALVTAPVQKSTLNADRIRFTGHTEFIGKLSGVDRPVMLLTARDFRVALATTHHPLKDVPNLITGCLIEETIETVNRDLQSRFEIINPRITILGLNPHAGEAGHLGLEEIQVIKPACDAARKRGLNIIGPISADTAFAEHIRKTTDAYIAMYHDQGLPALKALGFQETVNITLGLPFVRTSVDHGTALELAATGRASVSSMQCAIQTAIDLH